MKTENKQAIYWSTGVVGLLVVLAVIAYLVGWFDIPAQPAK